MRFILVDDEWLALISLEKKLLEIEGCEVVGKFIDAQEAIENMTDLRPDAVFLDIHMPELNGLEATNSIQAIAPETRIVFVTAHDDYAVDAFGLNATDYLLKPVNRERLGRTVKRLQEYVLNNPKPSTDETILFHCMGSMQIGKSGKELETLKWRTTKAKELFAYLLHHRGKIVSKDVLLELLWSELDESKGLTNLQTSIYRIRSLWKDTVGEQYITIQYSQYGYILETKLMRIDTEEWEQELKRLVPVSLGNISEHQQVLEMYRGDYYMEDNYIWAETERQRLKSLWLRHALELAQYYTTQGMDTQALEVYHHILKHDPLHEDSYFALMIIYARLNDANSVNKQYQFMVRILEQEAGAAPHPNISEWYDQWKHSCKVYAET